jgi:hypothetical protein
VYNWGWQRYIGDGVWTAPDVVEWIAGGIDRFTHFASTAELTALWVHLFVPVMLARMRRGDMSLDTLAPLLYAVALSHEHDDELAASCPPDTLLDYVADVGACDTFRYLAQFLARLRRYSTPQSFARVLADYMLSSGRELHLIGACEELIVGFAYWLPPLGYVVPFLTSAAITNRTPLLNTVLTLVATDLYSATVAHDFLLHEMLPNARQYHEATLATIVHAVQCAAPHRPVLAQDLEGIDLSRAPWHDVRTVVQQLKDSSQVIGRGGITMIKAAADRIPGRRGWMVRNCALSR